MARCIRVSEVVEGHGHAPWRALGFSLASIYFLEFRKEQAFFLTIQSSISLLTFSQAVPMPSPIQSHSGSSGFVALSY